MIAALLLGAALAAPPGIPACSELAPDAWQRVSARGHSEERVGLFKNTAWLFLRAYKVGVSTGDGDRCGMYPSCSAYTWRAVKRNGPVLGGWLGAARIMANHRDPDMALCTDGRRLLRVDLPEEGEFWRTSP